jgi:hypothetical protein
MPIIYVATLGVGFPVSCRIGPESCFFLNSKSASRCWASLATTVAACRRGIFWLSLVFYVGVATIGVSLSASFRVAFLGSRTSYLES